MYNILLYGSVLVLAFICVLVVLFVLMQRPSANSGMGSALGGATTESVFGGETASVLSKATVVFITLFFLFCAGLYFAFVGGAGKGGEGESLRLEATQTQAPKTSESLITEAPAENNAESVPAEKK